MCIQESKPHVTFCIFSYRSKTTLRVNVHPGNGKFHTLNTPAATKLHVNVHPGRGKTCTRYFLILSVGLHHARNGKSTLFCTFHQAYNIYSSATQLRVYACASRKRKICFTFHAFSRSLHDNKVTRLCMCIQETEIYFLVLTISLYTATKLRVYACASRKRKIQAYFLCFPQVFTATKLRVCMCIPDRGNRKSTLLSMLSVGLYSNKVTN